MDVIVLLEGSEEEPVARAPVPKQLVAVGLKPVIVSEKSRSLDVSPDQWWDRKLEPGLDDHLMSFAQWAASIEIWQRDQRELQQRVYKLEKEREKLKERVAKLEKKGKGKGKEKVLGTELCRRECKSRTKE